MKTTFSIIGAALLCSACGGYQLGYAQGAHGQTQAQFKLDQLTCKDEATTVANSAERQAQAFALGATLVGYPIAIHQVRQHTREAFGACMTARGYKYTAP
jgi:hypothetical protein